MNPETYPPTPVPTRKPARWPSVLVGLIPGAALLVLVKFGVFDNFSLIFYAYLADVVVGLFTLFRREHRWVGVGLLLGALPGVLGLALLLAFIAVCSGTHSCIVF